ncbi:MAG: hypothetical protein PHI56_05695 [Victivallaceae bacterium]|jgi:hypothetical protein|nr:hypothetical protein [Victivallaceae bacterium]MDD3116650.1 hypothetical protein [Victivallaceae bacterium]
MVAVGIVLFIAFWFGFFRFLHDAVIILGSSKDPRTIAMRKKYEKRADHRCF